MPLSTSNATSTIVLSSPAKYDSSVNQHAFSVIFNPPNNVAGRQCYLKCVSIMPQVTSGSTLDVACTYFVGISFSQPYSYTNLNNNIDSTATVTSTSKDIMHQSDIVGAIMISGDASTKTLNGFQGTFPRCLVQVPMYQEAVIVRLFKSNGSITTTTALESLTVVFELTPVDGTETSQIAP